MLLINASNIHTGGGAVLLRPLLQVKFSQPMVVWVDERFKLPNDVDSGVEVIPVRPSVAERLRADADLARRAKKGDIVLCLGNLPPIRKPPCTVIVYLQNRYLIGNSSSISMPMTDRIRLAIERIWLRIFQSHAQFYLVQTPSMRLSVLDYLGLDRAQVRLAPYLPGDANWPRSIHKALSPAVKDERPFLYVASGESHKNHDNLVDAWIQLANEGLYPHLQLTLDQLRFPTLVCRIAQRISQYGLQIEINAAGDTNCVSDLYKDARALIFASRFESFGLPLVEARQAGLPVLAPELDYVRDVLDPDETFDPDSARSIARAVKRFMGESEQPLPALGAEQFMQLLLKLCGQ